MQESTKETLIEAADAAQSAAAEIEVAEARAESAEARAEHSEERAEVIEAASVKLVEQVTEDTRLSTIEGNISTWHAALETLQSSVQAGLTALQASVQTISEQMSQALTKITSLETEMEERKSSIRQHSEKAPPPINPNNLNANGGQNPAANAGPNLPVRKKRKI